MTVRITWQFSIIMLLTALLFWWLRPTPPAAAPDPVTRPKRPPVPPNFKRPVGPTHTRREEYDAAAAAEAEIATMNGEIAENLIIHAKGRN